MLLKDNCRSVTSLNQDILYPRAFRKAVRGYFIFKIICKLRIFFKKVLDNIYAHIYNYSRNAF